MKPSKVLETFEEKKMQKIYFRGGRFECTIPEVGELFRIRRNDADFTSFFFSFEEFRKYCDDDHLFNHLLKWLVPHMSRNTLEKCVSHQASFKNIDSFIGHAKPSLRDDIFLNQLLKFYYVDEDEELVRKFHDTRI